MRDGQSLFEICGRLAMLHGIGSSRQTITRHIDVLEKAGMARRHVRKPHPDHVHELGVTGFTK